MKNDKLTSWPAFTSLSIRSRCASTTPGAASDYSSELAEVLSRDVNRRQAMSAKSKRSEENKLRKQRNQNLRQKEAGQEQRSESELSPYGRLQQIKNFVAFCHRTYQQNNLEERSPDADSCPARKTR